MAATAPLPRAWLRGSHDFSFSGLKTAVLHRTRAGEFDTAALAARFQESVVDVLATKTAAAAEQLGAVCVIVAGGVAANGALREALRERCAVPVRVPPIALCTDNAAMIGAAASYRRDSRRRGARFRRVQHVGAGGVLGRRALAGRLTRRWAG